MLRGKLRRKAKTRWLRDLASCAQVPNRHVRLMQAGDHISRTPAAREGYCPVWPAFIDHPLVSDRPRCLPLRAPVGIVGRDGDAVPPTPFGTKPVGAIGPALNENGYSALRLNGGKGAINHASVGKIPTTSDHDPHRELIP